MSHELKSIGALLAAMLITAFICGCAAIQPVIPGNSTPTSTKIIGAGELTDTPESGTPSDVTPNGSYIQGRYEAHHDVTVTDSKGYVHTKIDMVAVLSASARPGNTLSGTAQIVYNKDYQIAGTGCKTSWNTGNIAWSEQLHGTYKKMGDGSVEVSLLPDSMQGPGISEDYLCLGSVTEYPVFPGVAGTIVHNLYNFRQDLPVGGTGASGTDYFTVHLELLGNP